MSAVTITPAGLTLGRDTSGMPVGVAGGIEGNAALRALLDQIADMLPEEYRRKWNLRAKASDADQGVKVSQR